MLDRERGAAVRPAGLLAIDLMSERVCEARDITQVHARVEKDWAIVTRPLVVVEDEEATWHHAIEQVFERRNLGRCVSVTRPYRKN